MSLLSDKAVIVFDLDGTLVDSMTYFSKIAASVLSRTHGVAYDWALEGYRKTCGLPFDFQVEQLFPEDGRNKEAVREFDRIKLETYADCPFFAEVGEVVLRLKKNGLRLAVSSNNEQSIVESKFSSRPGFDLILGFRKPDFLKGRPHFDTILKTFSVVPDQILFVGDSLHDAVMADSCGVDFVGREGTFSRAEFEAQGMARLVVNDLRALETCKL